MAEKNRLSDLPVRTNQAQMIDVECAAELIGRGTKIYVEADRSIFAIEPLCTAGIL